LLEEERKLFDENNWDLIAAPYPNKVNFPSMPLFCVASAWLSMNFFQIDENTVVCEENEVEMHELLESLGFEVVKIPFRSVFMFGGGLHCSTWDIEREDSDEDFFPNR
jgi:glycine amidinotransferase